MMNYDVKQMYMWPLPLQLLVIAIVCITLFLCGYFFDIAALQAQIINDTSLVDDLKQQLSISFQKQVSATNDVAALPVLTKVLKEWETKLITENQLSSVQDQILQFSKTDGLKFNSFNPATPQKQGRYFAVPIDIEMVGTYDQIASFVSQIANMNSMVSIDDLKIQKDMFLPLTNTVQATNNPTEGASSTPAQVNQAPSETQSAIHTNAILRANLNIEIYRK